MDKHYGWQEGRGAQGQGRPQNGQRWNERYRDDDRDMRGARGGEYGGGWERDDRRFVSGGDLDREDYVNENEEYGGASRGNFGSRGQSWSQSGSNRGQSSQFGGNQGFSGGHYGGFANEGHPGQGNYGGNRGFSNQGFSNQGSSGQRFNQGPTGQGRGYSGQDSWNQGGWNQSGQSGRSAQNWGQTFGEGYSSSEHGNQGFGSGAPRSSGQGFGSQSRAQGYGGQSYGSSYQGRGFAGRGPKGYQRSDDRVKEQLSDRLMDDDDIDASEISIEVKNGEVTLTGTVGSREEKRAAEEIAEQSPGVREVQNLLRVSQGTSSGQFGQSGRSGQSGSTSGMSASGASKSQDATSGQSKSRNSERE
jgi:osmotically-inducible protein OsmY